MDIKEHYRSLTPEQKEEFAREARTTRNYIEIHLFARDPARRKIPRKDLMQGLADATGGKLSLEDITRFFYSAA